MENNKEPIKVRLSTVILCFIIVVLIVVIAIMYMQLNNNNNNNVNTSQNSTVNEIQQTNITTQETSSRKDLNVDSSEIDRLYSYIPAYNNREIEKNAYQSVKITVNDLPETYLLAHAFKQLNLSDEQKEYIDGVWYKFNAEILQNKVNELYGKKLSNSDFNMGYVESCSYNAEDNTYMWSVGGNSTENAININKIVKAYEENDSIYIIDQYMIAELNGETSSAKLYTSSDNTKLIANLDYNELEVMQDEAITDKVMKDYASSMQKYKHVFKKNATGNYYWYSTEPYTEN